MQRSQIRLKKEREGERENCITPLRNLSHDKDLQGRVSLLVSGGYLQRNRFLSPSIGLNSAKKTPFQRKDGCPSVKSCDLHE